MSLSVNSWLEQVRSLVVAACRSQARHFGARTLAVQQVCDEVYAQILFYMRDCSVRGEELTRYVRKTARLEARERYRTLAVGRLLGGRVLPLEVDQQVAQVGPLDKLIQAEDREYLQRLLSELAPKRREALLTFRRDRQEPTVKDLARRWNCTEGHVYYLRAEALKWLRGRMGFRLEDCDEN
jgi:DNA-directed RNA polymerase specialized sigma24 family protein